MEKYVTSSNILKQFLEDYVVNLEIITLTFNFKKPADCNLNELTDRIKKCFGIVREDLESDEFVTPFLLDHCIDLLETVRKNPKFLNLLKAALLLTYGILWCNHYIQYPKNAIVEKLEFLAAYIISKDQILKYYYELLDKDLGNELLEKSNINSTLLIILKSLADKLEINLSGNIKTFEDLVDWIEKLSDEKVVQESLDLLKNGMLKADYLAEMKNIQKSKKDSTTDSDKSHDNLITNDELISYLNSGESSKKSKKKNKKEMKERKKFSNKIENEPQSNLEGQTLTNNPISTEEQPNNQESIDISSNLGLENDANTFSNTNQESKDVSSNLVAENDTNTISNTNQIVDDFSNQDTNIQIKILMAEMIKLKESDNSKSAKITKLEEETGKLKENDNSKSAKITKLEEETVKLKENDNSKSAKILKLEEEIVKLKESDKIKTSKNVTLSKSLKTLSKKVDCLIKREGVLQIFNQIFSLAGFQYGDKKTFIELSDELFNRSKITNKKSFVATMGKLWTVKQIYNDEVHYNGKKPSITTCWSLIKKELSDKEINIVESLVNFD